jgi:HEPN superfamily Swt1-like protein
MLRQKPIAQWDVAALLKLMQETWNEVFAKTLGRADRSLVQELRDWRNKWAHQEPFSSDDADRALESSVTAWKFPDRLARRRLPFRWVDDNDHLGTMMPFGAPSTPSFPEFRGLHVSAFSIRPLMRIRRPFR